MSRSKSGVDRRRCFLDVTIDGELEGRIVIELFDEITPKTAENFINLCTGQAGIGKTTGKPLHYKGTLFHRVIKGFMIQGGDFSNANGTGGESIYGGMFEDEDFTVKHDEPFILSMANRGPNTNGSQFFITTHPAPHLDGVHVAFGKVVSGQEVVRKIENLKVNAKNRPNNDVIITNCGELIRKRRLESAASDSSEYVSFILDKNVLPASRKEKKRKKEKRRKRDREDKENSEDEAPRTPEHVSSVKKEDLPEEPAGTNRFLMRGSKAVTEESNDRGGRRRSEHRPNVRVTSSGHKIKGRGFVRYRTPERERSRSVTPPHWKREERRLISLEELKKRQEEQKEREQREARRINETDLDTFAARRRENESRSRRRSRSRSASPPHRSTKTNGSSKPHDDDDADGDALVEPVIGGSDYLIGFEEAAPMAVQEERRDLDAEAAAELVRNRSPAGDGRGEAVEQRNASPPAKAASVKTSVKQELLEEEDRRHRKHSTEERDVRRRSPEERRRSPAERRRSPEERDHHRNNRENGDDRRHRDRDRRRDRSRSRSRDRRDHRDRRDSERDREKRRTREEERDRDRERERRRREEEEREERRGREEEEARLRAIEEEQRRLAEEEARRRAAEEEERRRIEEEEERKRQEEEERRREEERQKELQRQREEEEEKRRREEERKREEERRQRELERNKDRRRSRSRSKSPRLAQGQSSVAEGREVAPDRGTCAVEGPALVPLVVAETTAVRPAVVLAAVPVLGVVPPRATAVLVVVLGPAPRDVVSTTTNVAASVAVLQSDRVPVLGPRRRPLRPAHPPVVPALDIAASLVSPQCIAKASRSLSQRFWLASSPLSIRLSTSLSTLSASLGLLVSIS
ncbi:Peptidyl-prolyl cis-trans isomerase 1 [Aphelenchoides avenae]|nr:Peptidyl-prolyl cis-trans isomerase 1 [Aphelenchus avenae]